MHTALPSPESSLGCFKSIWLKSITSSLLFPRLGVVEDEGGTSIQNYKIRSQTLTTITSEAKKRDHFDVNFHQNKNICELW